jgi:hypothetical protein
MNNGSLETVIEELRTANTSADLMLDNVDTLNNLRLLTIDMIGRFDMLIESNVNLGEILQGNRLQEREDRAELLAALRGRGGEERTVPASSPRSGGGNLGIFGTIAAIGAGMVGFVAGFLKEFKGILTKPLKLLRESKTGQAVKNLFTRIGSFFDDIITRFKNNSIVRKITGVFDAIGDLVTKFKGSSLFKGLSTFLGKIKSFFNIFSNSPIVKVVGGVFDVAKKLFGVFGDVFNGIKSGFSAGAKLGGTLGKLLKGVGRLLVGLGKIFGLPLTIILGIYGAITGFISGFKEGGIIGGIKGALVGIFDSLIGGLLDLIKDGISWVAGALGFENVEKALDGFSFTGLFKQFLDFTFGIAETIGGFIGSLFSNIIDFFSTLPDKLGDFFSGAMDGAIELFSSVGDTISEFHKKILRAILPDPNVKRAWYDPIGMIQGVIPDAVYKYAFGTEPAEISVDKMETAKASGDFSAESMAPDFKIETAKKTGDFSALSNDEKAKAAGHNSWKDYQDSGWQWKNNMQGVPSATGAALNAAGASASGTPTVIVNNNNGGNVSNVRSSNVNNNAPAMSPIMSASGMAFSY